MKTFQVSNIVFHTADTNEHKTWPPFSGTHNQVKGESDNKMNIVQYSDCNIRENEEKIW